MSMTQKFHFQDGMAYTIRQIRFMMLEGKSIEEALAELEKIHLAEMGHIGAWFKGMADAIKIQEQELANHIKNRNG